MAENLVIVESSAKAKAKTKTIKKDAMAKHLVIVESPAKAKTIKKYLGPEFEVLASYGHVRDLLPKKGAVDPDNDFEMNYQIIEKNNKHVTNLVNAMKKADDVYLATDPDREGEAISWHILNILKEKKALAKKPVFRIAFHEITQLAVQAAVANPREIAMDLVNSQQARRALDYLVGFNLSPLLWRKVRRGLSAGRVQSPALRLIVEREDEIEKFVSQEYWDLTADLEAKKQAFVAKLHTYQGEKLEQFTITNAEQAEAIKQVISVEAQGVLHVVAVEKKQRKRNPVAPFMTSTLQQEAARKLGLTTDRTMRIAQQLYEGIEIDSGSVGLISYMRTDSVNLAEEAIQEIRSFIAERYGKENVPEEIKIYKTKTKNAQEAHEAIRPTSVMRTPESIKEFVTIEQYKLYDLIWKRTVSCQMISATIDTVAVDLRCGKGNDEKKTIFRANGSVIADPGFMLVYQEGSDDKAGDDAGDDRLLPALVVGDVVILKVLQCNQHFTEPPPRYSEATLIKSLVECGIGRPSTYASIISTLQRREYALLENKRFKPTDVGRVVIRFLMQYFTRYVDYSFTAQLEDELDEVSRGEKAWVPLLREFWDPFKQQIDEITETVKRKDVTQETLEENCPTCAKPLTVRLGRRDKFIGCTGYPECTYTRSLNSTGEEEAAAATESQEVEGRSCTDCGSPLSIKQGRFGKFIGCSSYPKCKHVESLQKATDTGVECPECRQGKMLKRRSRRGKAFFSCSRYPDCKYATWNEPIAQPCPKCAWPILTIKITKKRGTEQVCPRATCGYSKQIEAVS